MAGSSEKAHANETPKKSDEFELAKGLALNLDSEELGLLIQSLQQEYEDRIAKEEAAARERRMREEIEARLRQARMELENRMVVHSSEFEDWSQRREAYISRIRGQQRVLSDEEEDHGADGKCRGSETETGSDDEDHLQTHPTAMAIDSDQEEVYQRREQRRREALFQIYWKEKTERKGKFARTMKEKLPGEGRSERVEEDSAESGKDSDEEEEEEGEEGDEDEEMNDYGPASSDSDGGDPDDGGYHDEMDDYEDVSNEEEYY